MAQTRRAPRSRAGPCDSAEKPGVQGRRAGLDCAAELRGARRAGGPGAAAASQAARVARPPESALARNRLRRPGHRRESRDAAQVHRGPRAETAGHGRFRRQPSGFADSEEARGMP